MADCPEFVVWNSLNAGWKFCAQVSAVMANKTASNDYDASIHIVQPGGTAVDWAKANLSPGPVRLPLVEGGYGATARLLSGPSAPTVTLHGWIENGSGIKQQSFNCTWSNSDAGTEFNVAIVLVVKAS